jgi:hypothetical protein
MGSVQVRGRAQPVTVYALDGRAPASAPRLAG